MDNSYFHVPLTNTVEYLTTDEIPTVVRKFVDIPMAEIPSAFDSTYAELMPVLAAEGIQPTGAAIALYHRPPADSATLEIGFPVDKALSAPVTTESGAVLEASTLPGGQIARVSHIGSYDALAVAWEEFEDEINSAGKHAALPGWEIYMTEPTAEMDPSTFRTDLIIVVND